MINLLNKAAKSLPYPIFLRLFYLKYFLSGLRDEERVRRHLGIPLLSASNLESYKQSDTLFILGSGSSVNAISGERWQAIAKHDTVGFNFWLFHPFVPKMYFIEAISSAEQPAAHATYHELANRRASDYSQTLKVATNLKKDAVFGGDWWKDMHTVHAIPIAARNADEIRTGLQYLEKRGLFAPSTRIEFLYKQASTLSALIALAIRMQYQKIVLCGIDLRDSRYFYQDTSLYALQETPQFLAPDIPHPTNVSIHWNTPVKEVVLEMHKLLLQPRGIELYVENRSSALYPEIPELAI